MRILTRYVLFSFLKNYLLAFGVLIGMYITLDIVMNFDELFKVSQTSAAPTTTGMSAAMKTISDILDFYLYQSVAIFVQLSPMIPVTAASFTLLRMTRNNETIATLASGIPLLQTAAPIIWASVVLTGAVVVAQETLIPAMIPKLIREHEDVGRAGRRSFAVKALEDGRGNILIAARFTPATLTAPASMLELDLLERDRDSRRPAAHVRASHAVWDTKANHWRLTGATRHEGLAADNANVLPEEIDVLPTTLTPDEVTLYRSRQFVELLPLSRINELLAAPRGYGNVDLLRVKHFRFAQWINNVILLLLIIPCVMTREPRTLKTGGSFLLLVSGAYMASVFICQHLAGSSRPAGALAAYWTPMMALTPPALFSLAAIWALDKIKT